MFGADFVPVFGAGADSTEAYAVGPVDVGVGVGAPVDDPKERTAAAPPIVRRNNCVCLYV